MLYDFYSSNDACVESIAKAIGLPPSFVKLPLSTVVAQLQAKFAGRNDITKAEVTNAIYGIYMEHAMRVKTETTELKYAMYNETILDEGKIDITNPAYKEAMGTFIQEFSNYAISVQSAMNNGMNQVRFNFLGVYAGVLEMLGDILKAITSENYNRSEVLGMINNLRETLQHIKDVLEGRAGEHSMTTGNGYICIYPPTGCIIPPWPGANEGQDKMDIALQELYNTLAQSAQ